MLLNFFIPIRGGEFAKGLYLNSNYNLPIAKALVWIFIDRFLDFLVVFILAAVLVFFVPTNLPNGFIPVLILLTIASVLATYLLTFQLSLSRKITKLILPLLIAPVLKKKLTTLVEFFLDTFKILNRNPLDLGRLFLITVLAYGVDSLIWYFSFLALNSNQNFLALFLGQLLSALTYLIPAAPGYVGSAEASGLLVFSGILGIEKHLSSAMIVLFHVLTILFVIAYGVISVYMLKVDLGGLVRRIFRK